MNARSHAEASGTIDIGGDLTVRRMGYGAMRITGDGIWGDPRDRDEAKAVLRRAVELGVNFIDTADSYGPHVSEELIAEALHPYPDDLVIATKGGLERTGPGRWPSNARPDHLKEVCDGSLRRLRLDEIPLYQLHRPDPKVPYDESVGALVELKAQGKIRHIGLSNVNEAELRLAQSLTPVVSVQNRYNHRDRQSESMLDLCEQEGIAFLPWAPIQDTGAGRLAEIAASHGVSTTQVVLAWLLARSPAMLPIPGTGSVAHLEENVERGEHRAQRRRGRRAVHGLTASERPPRVPAALEHLHDRERGVGEPAERVPAALACGQRRRAMAGEVERVDERHAIESDRAGVVLLIVGEDDRPAVAARIEPVARSPCDRTSRDRPCRPNRQPG